MPNWSSDAVPNVAPSVVPNVAPNVVPKVVPDVVPYVAPDVAPNVAPNVVPKVVPDVVPYVAPDVAPNVAPNESSDHPALRGGQTNRLQVNIDDLVHVGAVTACHHDRHGTALTLRIPHHHQIASGHARLRDL